ncbi:MAG TPA: FAD-dependent oxidoreductase [Opitutaceae bacterium]|nr:FAD-dependent oxidoreductase [Opitutaceae bacterium]
MKFDVVIAGGGFAGAYCARTLGKIFRHGSKRIALIAERNVLVFQPMLAEVAGSSLSPIDVVNPLRLFCKGVDVLQGGIQSIDWAKKELLLDGGRFTRNHTISFDHLVVTLGSVTDLSRVPGMADYGWPMKNVADALRLRAAIINRLEEANLVEDDIIRARLLTFVVVGGGYTGVETAGQLLDFIRGARRFYKNLQSTPLRVILVHSRSHLLEEIGEKLGDYARTVLERRGMEVRLNVRAIEATASCVVLDDGTVIEAHTIVSTIGNAPNPVILDLCKQLNIQTDKGRVSVEPSMRVGGHPNLWAAGDCAAVPWNDRGTQKIAPPTAQLALRQGTQLAQNLARALQNQPLHPFTYRYMGQMATIGEREAVAEVFGLHFRGFIAWWMWRSVYLAKLPGFTRRLRVMIDWTFELFFPRDISLFLPPPEDIIRSIHLQKDELLFNGGEKCRAYFYVRRGSVKLITADQGETIVPTGGVIDQGQLGANGCWAHTAFAAESSDLIVFRGKALELLRTELRLVPQQTPARTSDPNTAAPTVRSEVTESKVAG